MLARSGRGGSWWDSGVARVRMEDLRSAAGKVKSVFGISSPMMDESLK